VNIGRSRRAGQDNPEADSSTKVDLGWSDTSLFWRLNLQKSSDKLCGHLAILTNVDIARNGQANVDTTLFGQAHATFYSDV